MNLVADSLHILHGCARQFLRPAPAQATILTYHGILGESLPVPDWCFLDVAEFESQISFLSRHYDVVPLEEVLRPSKNLRRRVALTFDDGYASNFHLAFPLLVRFKLPATIFLVSDLMDTDSTVWFCRLHDAICRTTLSDFSHEGLSFNLRTTALKGMASATLQSFLKGLPAEALEDSCRIAVENLGGNWHASIPPESPLRMLSSAQVRRMADSGLVQFGAHTASHSILSLLDDEGVEQEISRSVRAVASLSGQACTTFAYPNGRAGDFDHRAVEALVRCGVKIGVTTQQGFVRSDDDPLRLKRVGIGQGESLGRLSFRLQGLSRHMRKD